MRNVLALAVTLLLTGGCDPSASPTGTAPPADAGVARQVFDFNRQYFVRFSLDHPCTGEDVAFEGKRHVSFQLWDDRSAKLYLEWSFAGEDPSGRTFQLKRAATLARTDASLPFTAEVDARIVSDRNEDGWLVRFGVTISEDRVVTVSRTTRACIG